MVGFHPNGLLVQFNRLLQFSLPACEVTHAIGGIGIMGIRLEGRAEMLQRQFRFALLCEFNTYIVVSWAIVGSHRQGMLKNGKVALPIPRLLVRKESQSQKK